MENFKQKLLPLAFSEDFLSGLESIDRDHRELFEQANSLLAMFLHNAPHSQIEKSFQDILNLLSEHFEDEEYHMQAAGYPQIDKHKKLHRRLTQDAQNLMTSYHEGCLSFGELHRFLSYTVIRNHMADEDLDFHRFL
jgi:hemerythrin-like metal-binding protein